MSTPGYAAIQDAPGLTIEGEHRSGEQIWSESLNVAGNLQRRGLGPGARVVISGETDHRTVTAFLGTVLAGAAPCLVAPSNGTAPGAAHLLACVTAVRPHAAIAWDGTFQGLDVDVVDHADAQAGPAGSPVPNDLTQTHHLQLTSGSTSRPKAVILSHGNVTDNVDAIARLSGVDESTRPVSWLPIYHDMGLVQVLISLRYGLPMSMMRPTSFLRRPLRWLSLMSELGGTHTAAPPFAFQAATQAAVRDGLGGLDLSTVRQVYVGAEPIPAPVLRDFVTTFQSAGLDPDAITPCYGLAEAVLAVTVSRGRTGDGNQPGNRFRVLHRPEGELVSCGEPIPGTQVRIVDENGDVLPEETEGAVQISGSSVTAGYLHEPAAQAGGWRDTGDQGVIHDGELYVTGRSKEIVIVNGRNYMPYDLEMIVERHPAIRSGGSVVMNIRTPTGQEPLVALVETRVPAVEHDDLVSTVRTAVRTESGLDLQEVLVRPPGTIPRTTSGKRQRGLARRACEAQLRLLADGTSGGMT